MYNIVHVSLIECFAIIISEEEFPHNDNATYSNQTRRDWSPVRNGNRVVKQLRLANSCSPKDGSAAAGISTDS